MSGHLLSGSVPQAARRLGVSFGQRVHAFALRSVRETTRASELLAAGGTTVLVIFGVLMAIASWPVASMVPQAGLDQSWQAGLAMAIPLHLQWGPSIDFTYGPLGFLVVPTLYSGVTALLSVVYLFVIHTALFVLLLRAALRSLSPISAVLVAFIVGASAMTLVDAPDLLMGITLLLGLVALRSRTEHARSATMLALGMLAGFGLLVKTTDGLLPLGVALVIAVLMGRRRVDLPIVLGSFAATLLILWAATGNSLGNLFGYLRTSEAIASGYSGAMELEVGRIDEWWYALVVVLLFAVIAWRTFRADDTRTQWCAGLVLVGFTWVVLKEGYVRHDGHDLLFFGLMTIALVALLGSGPAYSTAAVGSPGQGLDGQHLGQPAKRLGEPGPFAAVLGAFLVMAWAAAGGVPSNVVSLANDAHNFASELGTIASTHRRHEAIVQARAVLRAGYGLDAQMLALLRHQSVAIEPYENTLAYAYTSFTWDPVPILQSYSAYTTSLDGLNTKFLKSPQAPTRILYQPAVVYEGIYQDPFFESPTSSVVTLCRYVEVAETPAWQLLAKVHDRCGRMRVISRVTATFGETVHVPTAPPGYAVVATFHGVGASLWYRIENVALKAAPIEITSGATSYRFIAATAPDLHIMETPATLGYGSAYTPPPISSFSLSGGGMGSGADRYQVTFSQLFMARGKPPSGA